MQNQLIDINTTLENYLQLVKSMNITTFYVVIYNSNSYCYDFLKRANVENLW